MPRRLPTPSLLPLSAFMKHEFSAAVATGRRAPSARRPRRCRRACLVLAGFLLMPAWWLGGGANSAVAAETFDLSDAIVVVGCARDLSVVVIDNGNVRLESAAEYRGATCKETETGLRERLGAGFRVASIGPAGEHLVRYATISHDGRHAGRGGSGAILGSKNIKAIAVRGTQRTEWANPRELTALSKSLSKRSFGPATAKYRELGTAKEISARLKEKGILISASGPQILRACTHLDVSKAQCVQVAEAIRKVVPQVLQSR